MRALAGGVERESTLDEPLAHRIDLARQLANLVLLAHRERRGQVASGDRTRLERDAVQRSAKSTRRPAASRTRDRGRHKRGRAAQPRAREPVVGKAIAQRERLRAPQSPIGIGIARPRGELTVREQRPRPVAVSVVHNRHGRVRPELRELGRRRLQARQRAAVVEGDPPHVHRGRSHSRPRPRPLQHSPGSSASTEHAIDFASRIASPPMSCSKCSTLRSRAQHCNNRQHRESW